LCLKGWHQGGAHRLHQADKAQRALMLAPVQTEGSCLQIHRAFVYPADEQRSANRTIWRVYGSPKGQTTRMIPGGVYLDGSRPYICAMFDLLKNLLSDDGTVEAEAEPAFPADDQRLAEAALMFHVIAADGEITKAEEGRMKELLSERYDLSGAEFAELYEAAQMADAEAVDLYRFTSLLKARLDRDQRIAIIEHMWEMVFADGEMHEFEDNVVWRIAQLLEVETQDRIAMKQRVRARREN